MNNDSNVSMINGQSIFENLDTKESDELKELIKNLNIFLKEKDSTINIENVRNLINKANEYILDEDNNNINEINNLKNKIMKIISPGNRF